jgi:hypothetical protein
MERTLRQLSHRHSLWRAFSSFIELSALTLSNAFDLYHQPKREARYLQTAQGYSREELCQLASLLAMTTLALDLGFADVLGKLFTRLELYNVQAGQAYTPYPVAQAMARISFHDAQEVLKERSFLRVCEPCVGAGVLVIALAEAMQEAGVNYQQAMHVIATDIDLHAVHMASISSSRCSTFPLLSSTAIASPVRNGRAGARRPTSWGAGRCICSTWMTIPACSHRSRSRTTAPALLPSRPRLQTCPGQCLAHSSCCSNVKEGPLCGPLPTPWQKEVHGNTPHLRTM